MSHSVGLLGLGAIGIALGTVRASLGPWSALVHGFFVLVSVTSVVLAIRFWFRMPAIGTAIAAGGFIGASFLD